MHLRNIAFLFGATILVLLWHLLMPSMLNSYHNSNDGMQDILNLHTTFPPFARRPLTTWAVKGTMLFFKCNASTGFTIINFLFLYLNGIIIYFLSLSGNNNSTQSILNSIAFYLSFSVFFSFFAPIYTYDEPIQYFCLLGAIYFLAQKKWFVYLLAMPFLWLSLVARETSVLLFPALYYLVLDEKSNYISL